MLDGKGKPCVSAPRCASGPLTEVLSMSRNALKCPVCKRTEFKATLRGVDLILECLCGNLRYYFVVQARTAKQVETPTSQAKP
jgi:hypothetical protein